MNGLLSYVNHSPHLSIDIMIPEEVWSGNLIDSFILRIFGSLAYAHVSDGKLAPRLLGAYFLVIHSSLKDTVYGVLVPRQSSKAGILYLMNMLCFLMGKNLPCLLLMQVIYMIPTTRWS